jgi:hypothetical protein
LQPFWFEAVGHSDRISSAVFRLIGVFGRSSNGNGNLSNGIASSAR